jgi:hypothetical protein
VEKARFDSITRSLSRDHSRRGVAWLLGGLPFGMPLGLVVQGGVEAHRNHKHRKKKKKKHQLCAPESAAATCAGRCGTWPNNCGQAVSCPVCASGLMCLANGTCARACPIGTACSGLPGGCSCGIGPNGSFCFGGGSDPCPTPPCSGDTECLVGTRCQNFSAFCPGVNGNRCTPVCGV